MGFYYLEYVTSKPTQRTLYGNNCRDQWNLATCQLLFLSFLLREARREEGFRILDSIFGVSHLYHKSCKSFAAKFSNFNGYRNSASSGMNHDYLTYSVSLSEEKASSLHKLRDPSKTMTCKTYWKDQNSQRFFQKTKREKSTRTSEYISVSESLLPVIQPRQLGQTRE